MALESPHQFSRVGTHQSTFFTPILVKETFNEKQCLIAKNGSSVKSGVTVMSPDEEQRMEEEAVRGFEVDDDNAFDSDERLPNT